MARVVLGINAAHDAAACLLVDGALAIAVPEERLTRRKHHDGFPGEAVTYCLQAAGLGITDVDVVVLNEYVKTDFTVQVRRMGFVGALAVNPSHHLLHALYAVSAAGFLKPAVLVIDGSGYSYGEYVRRRSPLLGQPPAYSEMEESWSAYSADGDGDVHIVEKQWGLWEAETPYMRFPSLGHMFSAASEYIFGHMQHAGKTMGLAPYGDASRFPDPVIEYGPDGLTIDTEWITRLPERSSLPAHVDPVCRDLAAKVQSELEPAVIFLCRKLYDATGADSLCVSGGVGLNSVANGRILRDTPFRRLFVTPASDDSGVAIGAAIYGHRHVLGEAIAWSGYVNFHGKHYPDHEVEAVLRRHAGFLRSERPPDLAEAAAADIAAGRFVGWFEGASEFGPRALGHRSILCDPRPADMRDRLNSHVKFREPFRPYAASVLTEHARSYFDIMDVDPFMMTVARIIENQRAVIPSVCHIDGTCRIQTVDVDYPGRYRAVIERFLELSGVPMVLNTSFNIRGEPIVETPADALRCFLGCNLDVLYLGDHRIQKVADIGDVPFEVLVPHLNEGISISSQLTAHGGTAGEPEHMIGTRTGHRERITLEQFAVLQLIDACRSVAELRSLCAARGHTFDVGATIAALRRGGHLSLSVDRCSRRER